MMPKTHYYHVVLYDLVQCQFILHSSDLLIHSANSGWLIVQNNLFRPRTAQLFCFRQLISWNKQIFESGRINCMRQCLLVSGNS